MIPYYYQQMKLVLINGLSLSRDALHIYIGFFILILTLALTKKKLHQWSVLLPAFILSILAEVIDFWDELNTIGRLLIGASIHDVINTNLIPFILVLWARKQHKRFT